MRIQYNLGFGDYCRAVPLLDGVAGWMFGRTVWPGGKLAGVKVRVISLKLQLGTL
jgi:hypothetical protein